MCDSDNKTPIVLKTLKEWSRDKSDGSIEIEIVYDDSGDLFFKSCKPSTDVFLDTAKRTIHISEKDGPDYYFAIDYWIFDHGRYFVHASAGYDIYFVDWGAVNKLGISKVYVY